MKRLILIFSIGFWTVAPVLAQHTHQEQRKINFPDTPDYVTLIGDFHIHTVFSDGNVWPSIRVQEAIRDGLDIISLTEHLEYQPHSDDIPHPDRNRSFDIAVESAQNSDLIVVKGSEITRKMPPGHSNSVFITDSNPLLQDNVVDVFREATSQGGFTFWNHPDWTSQQSDGIATLSPVHRQLIADGLLHGIEVVNTKTYSEEALQIAFENDLTIMGTSDVHGLIDWDYEVPCGGHRPVTLVLSRERTPEAVKEALFAGRTVVWSGNTLIGKEENVAPLVAASLTVESAAYGGDTSVLTVRIRNNSDAMFVMKNLTGFSLQSHTDLLMLQPHEVTTVGVRTIERKPEIELSFEFLNVVTAPRRHLMAVLNVVVE